MVTSPSTTAYIVLVLLVALERVNELRIAARNARKAFASGGVEIGQAHYRVMAMMHTAFLFACVGEVVWFSRPFPGALGWVSIIIVLAAQSLRVWVLSALGERWNTRIIVVPNSEPVTRGPYRFLRHPNYVAVIAEIAFLPLVHGAWITALVFSVANAIVLFVRIRAEEQALGAGWATTFASRPRFIPGGHRA
jgi:methyltransferase